MCDYATPCAVIGGGLAGCECALALAGAGLPVTLFEMKPFKYSAAHTSPHLGELVCSNSFRSTDLSSAVGLLKEEMRALGSAVLAAADDSVVPAGKALAVDRERFAAALESRVAQSPDIQVIRREITDLNADELAPFAKVVAAPGPLASPAFCASLEALLAEALPDECAAKRQLYFYDAIAPIISAESVDMRVAFRGSRYGRDGSAGRVTEPGPASEAAEEGGDYLNCPFSEEEYLAFHAALVSGRTAPTHEFEAEVHFEGCMPIEALAARGEMTLAFGPFKPVGFVDPRTGRRPFALVQLRTENLNRSMFNLVGCQTKLTHSEQERIFRMIPGLAGAEFVRHGSMHRNTFVNAPKVLLPDLSLVSRPDLHLAGQITGVEGYVESAACGLWVGLSLAAALRGLALPDLPPVSALGALLAHLRTEAKNFQPSNVQFGLMPELGVRAGKAKRKLLYGSRTSEAFKGWLANAGPILARLGVLR